MLGKDLSNALSGIADDKIESAMNAYARRKARVRQGWLRVAAVAATLAILLTAALWPAETEEGFITAPGVMKVYAYDSSTGTSTADMELRELEAEMRASLGMWWKGMNSEVGIPLKYVAEDDALLDSKVTFQIRVNGGEFFGDRHLDKYKENPNDSVGTMDSSYLGTDFQIDNGETVSWSCLYNRDYLAACDKDGGVFAEAIIRADGQIIGFSVVQIHTDSDNIIYYATLVASVYYPKKDGAYQPVTEEYVRQEIANCRAEAIKKK